MRTNCLQNIIIKDRVKIYPHLLNEDLLDNVLNLIKKKYENRCNKDGYILKINDINLLDDNYIDIEDNSSAVINLVNINLNICIPMINDLIILKVIKVENALKIAQNGPLYLIIKEQDDLINKNNFKLMENKIYNINTKTNLKVNDYIEVIIKQFKIQPYNDKIILIGYLNNIIDENEATNYIINENNNINNKKLYDIIIND